MLGIGDVASSCGPSPCTWQEALYPGAACQVWNACAAAQAPTVTIPPVSVPCIVGGLDENGNTIVSCGSVPCLTGPGPLQPGQEYCSGVLGQGSATDQTASSVGIPQWALLGGIVFLVAMIAIKR